MALKPTRFPRWAENDENDPVTSAPNKSEPPEAVKLSGLKREQPLPREWFNDTLNLTSEWLEWLEETVTTLATDTSQTTLQAVYPVGSYYMNASDNTDPATLFGFGTWVRVEGKFIVGQDDNDTAFDGAGEEGGSKTHTHSDTFAVDGHQLTVNEMPSHSHTVFVPTTGGGGGTGGGDSVTGVNQVNTSSVGGDQPHTHNLSGGVQSASNLPPYKVAYIWYRTA